MTIRDDLIAQIEALQARLAIIDNIGEDTFPFGTVVVFSAATGVKWHYVKTNEETWLDMQQGINIEKRLVEWILDTIDSGVGYFEVYALIAAETPFFASS